MHSAIRKGGAGREGEEGEKFISAVNSWLLRGGFYCPPEEQ